MRSPANRVRLLLAERRGRTRRLTIEQLEPRQLLAICPALSVADVTSLLQRQEVTGATVLTHGFQFTDDGGDSLASLAQTVRARIDLENGPDKTAWLLDYDIADCNGHFTGLFDGLESSLPDSADSATGEVVLLFDWARESNESSAGWGSAAGDALFNLLVRLDLVSATTQTSVPLHMIAHSFGSAVTSEAVERLVTFGIPVDQVTYLDPHDFDQSTLPVDGAQRLFELGRPDGYGATSWENVRFTDVYYQTDAILIIPDGRPIPGAYNVLVNDQVGGLNPHTAVWDQFYRETVENRSSTTGYAFSRIAGRVRPDLADSANQAFRYFSVPATAQDHERSPSSLTDHGDPLDQDAANFRRWAPEWNPLEIVNGDFQNPGSTSVFPGWANHGGGGSGRVVCAAGDCHLTLDKDHPSRIHNDIFLPASVRGLHFDLKRTSVQDDAQLEVRVDGEVLATFPLKTVDDSFTRQAFGIPSSLRAGSHALEFAITARESPLNASVQVDNVRMAAWQNPAIRADVTGDLLVVPGDALLIINEINIPRISAADGELPAWPAAGYGPPFFDVNGDDFVAPLDVLVVINHINAESRVAGGEAESGQRPGNSFVLPTNLHARDAVQGEAETEVWADTYLALLQLISRVFAPP